MNKIETYRAIIRPTLALVAGAIFVYLSVTKILPVEAVAAIIGVVFTFYYQSRMSDKITGTLTNRIAELGKERRRHITGIPK